jgi:type VI secretion system FHA domain protein
MFLRLINRPQTSSLATTEKEFLEHGGNIGRAEHCDFVLPDDSKNISKVHALIHFRDNRYFITDVSTNGVFCNYDTVPIGKGNTKQIFEGDIFKVGEYFLKATFQKQAEVSTQEVYSLLKKESVDNDDLERLLTSEQGTFDNLLENDHDPLRQHSGLPEDKSIDDILAELDTGDEGFDLNDLVQIPVASPIHYNVIENKTEKAEYQLAKKILDEVLKAVNLEAFDAMFSVNKDSSWFTKDIYTKNNIEIFYKHLLSNKEKIIQSVLNKK